MKQISITIALALSCTIANAQNIKGSHEVRANDEVKRQQVENRSENRPLIYHVGGIINDRGNFVYDYINVWLKFTNQRNYLIGR